MKVTPATVTASRYFRIYFVPANWTEPFYANLDYGSVLIFVE